MAIEKMLNTRIQLKYDSYANWEAKNPTLKSGEVAIAYLASAHTATTPDNNTHPVMFKVGPGAFNSLPWASALAADVHAWAKKSEADFTTWVKSLVDVSDIDAYSKSEVDNLLNAKVNNTDFATFKTENTAAIATAKGEVVAAAAEDAAAKVKALADGAVKDNADAIAAIKDHASVDSFADVMTEMAKYQVAGDYATKAEAQGYADAKDAAIAEAKKAGTDANAALEAYKATNDVAVGLKAAQADLEAEIARAQAAEKANSDAIALLIDSTTGDETKLNSIKELATWIEEHGGDAAEMAEAIEANATAIGAEKTRAEAEEARLAGLITAHETAVNNTIANYYTKAEADAEFMNATETDNAIDAKVTALNLAATYEPIGAETRANAYADGLAVNYATAAQGAKADSALQEITTTENGGLKVTNKNQIDIDTNVVFVFNCGDASTLVD